MTGYKRAPRVRFTPVNGSQTPELWNLDTLFDDTNGPVRIDVSYQDVRDKREGVDRSDRSVTFGWRCMVEMDFPITTMERQAYLATLSTRLSQPSEWFIELSLDGGIVWREVVLRRSPTPAPFRNVTLAGASFSLSLDCVPLLTELPSMTDTEPDIREHVYDGGFESWASATNLDHWTESVTAGSANRESASVSAGTYAARLDKSAGAGTLYLQQSIPSLVPGSRYRLSVYGRASGSIADVLSIVLRNSTQSTDLDTDGTWGAASKWGLRADGTTSYVYHELEFDVPSGYGSDDAYVIRPQGVFLGVGESVYYDSLSLKGPIRPDGVSAW